MIYPRNQDLYHDGLLLWCIITSTTKCFNIKSVCKGYMNSKS